MSIVLVFVLEQNEIQSPFGLCVRSVGCLVGWSVGRLVLCVPSVRRSACRCVCSSVSQSRVRSEIEEPAACFRLCVSGPNEALLLGSPARRAILLSGHEEAEPSDVTN